MEVAAGATQSVAEGQAGAGLLQNSGVVGLCAAGAERVVEVEVQAVVVIGGDERAGGVDVGVLPSKSGVRVAGGVDGAGSAHAHLSELLAAQAEDVVVGGLEAVDSGVAGPGGDASLGHARAVGVIEVAGHGGHVGDGGAGHSPVQRSVAESPRFHDGISIALKVRKTVEVRDLRGP